MSHAALRGSLIAWNWFCLQMSGMSRELFDQLCDDPKSAVIIPGYMVKGTFSESVGATFSKGEMIPTLSGDMKPFNIRVEGTLRTPLFCSVFEYCLRRALD